MTAAHRRAGTAASVRLLGPAAIWALHFFALYAAQTVFCTWAGAAVSMLFVIAAGLAAASVLVWLMSAPMRAGQGGEATRFVDLAGFALSALSLCAIVWQTLPALLLPSCTPPL